MRIATKPRVLSVAPLFEKGFSSPRRIDIPSLDGIRAFSIGLVFLSHTQLSGMVPSGLGVTIFFFLSGYLITTLLRREVELTGRISLKMFYLRRFLRIFPPMYAALGMGLLLIWSGLLPNTLLWGGFFSHFFYYTNHYMIFGPRGRGWVPGLESLWSLAVEEHFYLIFPILYLTLRRLFPKAKDQFWALGSIWLAISAWRCALVLGWNVCYTRASLATDTRLDSILIGCMLAIRGNPFFDRSRLSDSVWKWLLSVSSAVVLLTHLLPGVAFRESIRYSIHNLSLVPVFVCAVRFANWGIFRLLNLSWIRFICVLSYSLYLIHYSLIRVCSLLPLSRPLQDGVALLLSLLTAFLMHLLIERPCGRLRNIFSPLRAERENVTY